MKGSFPYSVSSILELHKTSSRFKHTYNRTYPKYDKIPGYAAELTRMNGIITEDTNSGYELLSYIASQNGLWCLSAGGRNGILAAIQGSQNRKLVVADGAAFGANIAAVYKYMQSHEGEVALYLPESFEWVILASGILTDERIEKILDNPAEYIESSEFFSWERFFTYLLEETTKGKKYAYNKKKLSDYYLGEGNLKKIEDVIRNGRW